MPIKLQVNEKTILLECDDESHIDCSAQWVDIPRQREAVADVSTLNWIINYGKEHAHGNKLNVENHEKR
jgi:hypothetical protein